MLTIIEPAAFRLLTTPEALAAEVGADDWALIDSLILRASAMVESICGRSFAEERVREIVSGRGGEIILSRWPVTALHSISLDGTAVSVADFGVHAGILRRIDGSSHGRFGSAVIEYTAGYVLPGDDGRTLPHDIERVVLALARQEFHLRGRDPTIRSEEVEGVGATTYFAAGSLLDAEAALARYREPVAL